MSKSTTCIYSRSSREAVTLLGLLIRSSRTEQKLTAQEVAERAGVSRGLLRRIERGDLKCGIGAMFEVAAIVGVQLFGVDEDELGAHVRRVQEKLTLLPKSVRQATRIVDDDF